MVETLKVCRRRGVRVVVWDVTTGRDVYASRWYPFASDAVRAAEKAKRRLLGMAK